MRAIAVRVEWEGKAPTTVYVPAELIEMHDVAYPNDLVANYISDQHGFEVKAWEVVNDEA